MSLISVDQIARELCGEVGDVKMVWYDRFVTYIVRAFNQLNMYNIPFVVTRVLPINFDTLSVLLPEDYIYYTKIGVAIEGRLVTLGINDSLMTPGTALGYSTADEYNSLARKALPEQVSALEDQYQFTNVVYGNQNIGEVYGAVGGLNDMGYYREDKLNNMIQLGSIPNLTRDSQVYLEYKSNLSSQSINYLPIETQEAIMAFSLDRFYANTDKARSDRERKRYEMEYNLLKKLNGTSTKQEYIDRYLRTIKSTVKR